MAGSLLALVTYKSYHSTSHPRGRPLSKNRRQQVLARMRRKQSPVRCGWERKMVQPLWKTVGRFLTKLKIELPYDPAIWFLAYILRNWKQGLKETCVDPCSQQRRRGSNLGVRWWMNVVHPRDGTLFRLKRKEILTPAQHGWTLKVLLGWVKWASHEKTNSVWFHWYEVLS